MATITPTAPVQQTAEVDDQTFSSSTKFVQALGQVIRLDAKEQYDKGNNSGRTRALVNRPECTPQFLATVHVPAENVTIQTLITDLLRERRGAHVTEIKGYVLASTPTKQQLKFPIITEVAHTRDLGDAIDHAIWDTYTQIAAGR